MSHFMRRVSHLKVGADFPLPSSCPPVHRMRVPIIRPSSPPFSERPPARIAVQIARKVIEEAVAGGKACGLSYSGR